MSELPPFLIFFAAALAAAFTRGLPRQLILLATPVVTDTDDDANGWAIPVPYNRMNLRAAAPNGLYYLHTNHLNTPQTQGKKRTLPFSHLILFRPALRPVPEYPSCQFL